MSDPNNKQNPVQPEDTMVRQQLPKYFLRGVSGQYFGKVIPLTRKMVIGRGSECDLVLNDQEISRHHAQLENTSRGVILKDLGSANGCFVNNEKITELKLDHGDQLSFDRQRFLLEKLGMESKGLDSDTSVIEDSPPPQGMKWLVIGIGLAIAVGAVLFLL